MRINKYLSSCGLCSRREADRLVEQGRVTVDGKTAVPGTQAEETSVVLVDGRKMELPRRKSYYMYNKPRGVVCTFERREPDNLSRHLKLPVRVTYAGRLDRDSEGLLLLTDDGDLIEALMHARAGHEKEYVVQVDRGISEEALNEMASGMFLPELGVKTRPCRIIRESGERFRIVLTQGINRQIRRMCREAGCRVTRLTRVRVANLQLGELPAGKTRELSKEEIDGLFCAVRAEGK